MIEYIKCPECGGDTRLYVFPEKNAGVYECMACDYSDTCGHEEQHSETIEVDGIDSRGEHTTHLDRIMVCDECRLTVGPDDSEPDNDYEYGED